jgi:hypothetical protein
MQMKFVSIYGRRRMRIDPAVVERLRAWNEPGFPQAGYAISETGDRMFGYWAKDASRSILQTGPPHPSVQFFDGVILQGGKLIQRIDQLSPFDIEAFEHDYGKYCLGSWSADGDADYVCSAVMASYQVYALLHPWLVAFSNDPHLLALIGMTADGRRGISFNLANVASMVNQVQIPSNRTVYRDVFMLPTNSGALINGDNEVSCYSLVPRMYRNITREAWEADLDTAQQQVSQASYSLYQDLHCRLGEITGGIDSRLQLAVSLHNGTASQIEWYLNGQAAHPDVIVAQLIAKKFGLRLTVNEPIAMGDAARAQLIQDKLPATVTRMLDTHGTIPFFEAIHNIILEESRTKGVLGAHQSRVPQRFGGGANETFRGWMSDYLVKAGVDNAPANGWSLLARYINAGSLRFLYQEPVANELLSDYRDLFSLVPTRYDIDLAFYALTRYRTFAMSIPNNGMQVQFGVSSPLHRLAYNAPPELFAINNIHFRIMANLCPELLRIPMAEKVFHPFNYAGIASLQDIAAVQPIPNPGNLPVPSHEYLAELANLLTASVKLHPGVFEVFKESTIQTLTDRVLTGLAANQLPIHDTRRLVSIYGLSIFAENVDQRARQRIGSPLPRLQDPSGPTGQRLHSPNPGYRKAIDDVLRGGCLLFQGPLWLEPDERRSLTADERQTWVRLLRK